VLPGGQRAAFSRIGNSRRGPGYAAALRFLNGYLIYFERAGSGAIERDHGLRVRPFRGHFRGLRLRQIGLILDHHIIRRQADVKGLLFHFYGLLLKNTALDGGFVSGSSLLHGDISVGYFQANLVLELLAAHLSLPHL
jgi:hypothetical protein